MAGNRKNCNLFILHFFSDCYFLFIPIKFHTIFSTTIFREHLILPITTVLFQTEAKTNKDFTSSPLIPAF